jgi:hypothetical protein
VNSPVPLLLTVLLSRATCVPLPAAMLSDSMALPALLASSERLTIALAPLANAMPLPLPSAVTLSIATSMRGEPLAGRTTSPKPPLLRRIELVTVSRPPVVRSSEMPCTAALRVPA